DDEDAAHILSQEVTREVRCAALEALRSSRSDAALDALMAAASDHAEVWDKASSILASLPHPGLVDRLTRELASAAADAAGPKAKGNARGKAGAVQRACRLATTLTEVKR